jgi:hypothetical protein
MRKYKGVANLELARHEQENNLQQFAQDLNHQLNDINNLIDALRSTSEESFIKWVTNHNKPLTKEQGSILLRFCPIVN